MHDRRFAPVDLDVSAGVYEEDAWVREVQPALLLERLARESPTAELSHVVLAALVGLLCWGYAPASTLGLWFCAIAAATLWRVRTRRRLGDRPSASLPLLRGVRISVVVVALTWSTGALFLARTLPFELLAVLMVVFAGLAAGATVTLLADRSSFRGFVIWLIGPLCVSVLMNGHTRTHVLTVALILMFVMVMMVVYDRGHRALLSHLDTMRLLRAQEQATSHERAYLAALLGGAPTAIATIRGDGSVLSVNAAFERLFGYEAAEVVGRRLNDLIVSAEEREAADRLQERARDGASVVSDVERRRSDGVTVPVRVSAAPVRGAGEGTLLVLYDDRTLERRAEEAVRAAERHYRELVESASDLVWQVDDEGRWTYVNEASDRIYGMLPEQLVGRLMFERVDESVLERDRAALQAILAGNELSDYETVHRDQDGRARHLSFSARPVRDTSGIVRGAHGIARDVSDRVAAREALEEARAIAERIGQAKSAFLANMSHEIRTPMNGVMGMTELLLDTELSDDQRRSAELIRTSAEALLAVIDDILDFSKIEAGRLSLEEIPLDLHALIDSTARLLAIKSSERRIEIVCDIDAAVPRTVNGDPARLRQVLTNLLSNAVKFTHDGDILVSARIARQEGDMAEVSIDVRDSGIGIPPDKLEAIFEDFSQADASTTRRYGGTGLGLAICKRLVTLMGGRIEVTSEVGEGSTFTFVVPLRIGEELATARAADLGVLESTRAIVIDNNATNRRIVREMLGGAGVEVDEADDAEKGLAALERAVRRATPYDLAVIDGHMPGRDGFELAEAVRQDPRLSLTRLLMLTSMGDTGDGARCRELGIEGYMNKPVAKIELLEAAATLLDRGRTSATQRQLVTRHSIAEARRRMRILLAEDNPVNQHVAAAMLRKRGHEVEIVDNGRKAVDAIAARAYDLVLMDIQMPEMDGIAATAAIRALPDRASTPIVAMTAHALQSERERCLSAGMDSYLSKPFNPTDLFAAVEGAHARPVAPAAPAQSGEPPVDLDSFRASLREAGIEDALAEMVEVFLGDAPERMAALEAAILSGSAVEIAAAAHAYKSAAATIGARALAGLLRDAEYAGKDGESRRAAELLDRLQAEHSGVLEYLNRAA